MDPSQTTAQLPVVSISHLCLAVRQQLTASAPSANQRKVVEHRQTNTAHKLGAVPLEQLRRTFAEGAVFAAPECRCVSRVPGANCPCRTVLAPRPAGAQSADGTASEFVGSDGRFVDRRPDIAGTGPDRPWSATMHGRLKDYYMKVLCQCYSDDGRTLVCGNNYGELILFDVDRALDNDGHRQDSSVTNGTGGSSSSTALRDSRVRKQVSTGALYCLTSAGEYLLAGGVGEVLAFAWSSVLEGRLEVDWALRLPMHSGLNKPEVNSLVLGDGNQRAYLASGDNKVHLFELETRQLLGSLEEHQDYVHGVAINRSESELYSAGEDGAVKLWDLRSRKTVCSVDVKKCDKLRSRSGASWVGAVALDRSEEWLLVSGGHLPAVLHTKSMSPTVVFGDVDNDCYVATFSNDLITVAGEGGKVYHYTLSGDLRAAVPSSSAAVYSVAMHPDKRCVSTAGASNKIDLSRNLMYNDVVLTV
ncbi:THO complex subunit 6-like [Tropilaelaps mercedesae]|uniref:THO complex subunit 6-like n=1 Tax=Tropilaelaps mercedesae TaxID=418985 RepID=A0A1V9XEZ3_9ACAR|nr:THO complex subunit 6-like [Tropilaelaps mercedesae]